MREKLDFTDQVVVISGGSGYIGQRVASEFALEGADVVIADIDEEGGKEVADNLSEEYGRDTMFQYTDVSDYDNCQETIDSTVNEFGGVDVLVNLAVARVLDVEDITESFVDESPETWDPEYHVTFKGMLNMTHNVLPSMIEQESGAIINYSSELYKGHTMYTVNHMGKWEVYGAMKAAIWSFTSSLAKVVGRSGVRVNAIAPGLTPSPHNEDIAHDDTAERVPLNREGRPEDHAYATLFLASEAASWITGQTLSVNGGAPD